MWLTKLKIAVVEKDTKVLNQLLDNIPKLESKEEAERALHLLKEASIIVHTLKDETALNMSKIKKNLQFLDSTKSKSRSKLDVKL